MIPKENSKDIPRWHLGLNIHPVETAEEAFKWIFADDDKPVGKISKSKHKKKISVEKTTEIDELDKKIEDIANTTLTAEELEFLNK